MEEGEAVNKDVARLVFLSQQMLSKHAHFRRWMSSCVDMNASNTPVFRTPGPCVLYGQAHSRHTAVQHVASQGSPTMSHHENAGSDYSYLSSALCTSLGNLHSGGMSHSFRRIHLALWLPASLLLCQKLEYMAFLMDHFDFGKLLAHDFKVS